MKTKLFLIALTLTLGLTSNLFAGREPGKDKLQKNKDWFRTELSLSEARQGEVDAILEKYHQKIQAKRQAFKADREASKDRAEKLRAEFLAADETTQIGMLDQMHAMHQEHAQAKKAKHEEMKSVHDQMDNELKGVLSNEEFRKYERFRKEQQVKAMKRMMEKREKKKKDCPCAQGPHDE